MTSVLVSQDKAITKLIAYQPKRLFDIAGVVDELVQDMVDVALELVELVESRAAAGVACNGEAETRRSSGR